ncbi:MAG TPA: hypothetical protein VFZ53_25605 [Polyangiaceae bacterium]
MTLLAVGCGHERFDLLPPPDAAGGGGTAGFAGAGGRSGGSGGNTGRSGSMNGGPSGRDAGPPPVPDCPDSQPNCTPCATSYDCVFGTVCDSFRNYCAPYCGPGFEEPVRCVDPVIPVCDWDRELCAECTIDTHCGPNRCEFGKCVPRPPPECYDSTQCKSPEKPFCWDGYCRPCGFDDQCGMGEHCVMGRCEPDGP